MWPLWTKNLSPWELHRKTRSRIGMLDVKAVRCLDDLAAWVLDIADQNERRN
ncbi:hypothetical protein [Nocardia iowensis]|uniref:Uncharacterized protein n=1 Tax=Nocardia iowensis TaxID=204891 RepID=A0ABX8S107_NOCIO|nr:hypothetical protein [Nocardia iowensis]QXN94772.1 hypothetical protein KV110_18010 [Nocardia iowensis]